MNTEQITQVLQIIGNLPTQALLMLILWKLYNDVRGVLQRIVDEYFELSHLDRELLDRMVAHILSAQTPIGLLPGKIDR